MHRLYIDGELTGETVSLSDTAQLHHLRDVLRLRTGDELVVFDSRGNEYDCLITSLNRTAAVLTVRAKRRGRDSKVKITVACAVPGKSRMDDVVDNLTQLGIDVIIPLETERAIVRLEDEKRGNRLERWRRIARSAAEQSQRSRIPSVEPVTALSNLLSRAGDFDLKLMPTLFGERRHLREVLAGAKADSILVLIGPEGDFTPGEVEQARNAGFIPVSLGESVLRVATAATAVASYIIFSLAD